VDLVVGESLGVLLASGLCSAEGLKVKFTVVGTGLALGSEVGEPLELGAELIAGESLGVLLASGLCSADGL
jgi:hypothetical protein